MIGQVIEVADKVLGKFIPDKNLKMKLQKEMTMAFHDANLAQIELNKAIIGNDQNIKVILKIVSKNPAIAGKVALRN